MALNFDVCRILWQQVDGTTEVLDNRTGMLMENSGVSSVCKNALFGEFRSVTITVRTESNSS